MKRRSTAESRIPVEKSNFDQKSSSPGPGHYIDIYKNSQFNKIKQFNENKF